MVWDNLADDQTTQRTVAALKQNGIDAVVVSNGQEAKEKVLAMIAPGSEVMTMSSVTLDTVGLTQELNQPDGKWKPVRDKLYAMDRTSQAQEMNRLGAAP